VLGFQGCGAFLPFGPLTLKTLKPLEFVEHPVTLGQHLRKARIQRGLLQKEVAAQMGFIHETYMWWERDRYLPYDKSWKPIIEFLGYYPIIGPLEDHNPFLAKRRHLGLSIKAVSRLLGVYEETYSRIEKGITARGKTISHKELVERFYALT